MKWFKHMSDASEDEFLTHLEEELGLEAIARWWKLLEAIARQMDKTDRCSATHPMSKWMTILSCKQAKVLQGFLKVLQMFDKCFVKQNENFLEITCPKLLEFRDEYSRKSGHTPDSTPDKVAPDIRKKKEEVSKKESKKEEKENLEKKKATRFTLAPLPQSWKDFCLSERSDLHPEKTYDSFSDYWAAVPGAKGTKLDWFATWRNWVRGQKQNNPQKSLNLPPAKTGFKQI